MDVSIIIVSWNTKRLLRDCLISIYEQAGNVDYEIIVLDNASTDGSAEMVKSDFPEVVLLENPENRGFAAASNQGIAASRGRYILLLNSDTVILNNAIEKVISFADMHPETGVIGCRVLNPDGTLQPTCFMFPSLLNMVLSCTYLYKVFPQSRFFGREHMTWWERDNSMEVDVITGCFMLVRREAFERVGLLDERFFMYGEEADWCYRFKINGWKRMFTPTGEIVHFGGQSTSQKPVAMIVQLRVSILKFVRKHYGWVACLAARFLVAFFFVVRLPIWCIIAFFRPRERDRAAVKIQAYSIGIANAIFGHIDS
jgi:GT2 family glycosyltransferase